jgi:putative transposase
MANGNGEWRTGRHVVFRLHVHLVFVTRYRRGAIADDLHELLNSVFASVCRDFEAELLEYGGEDDHVHLLVAYPPKVSISKLVNSLKGVSARRVRALNRRDVPKKLWGSAFWSPSYCAVSSGGASIATVRAYIEKQRGFAARQP